MQKEAGLASGAAAAASSAEQAAKEEADSRSVYVGNVDYACTPEELQVALALFVLLLLFLFLLLWGVTGGSGGGGCGCPPEELQVAGCCLAPFSVAWGGAAGVCGGVGAALAAPGSCRWEQASRQQQQPTALAGGHLSFCSHSLSLPPTYPIPPPAPPPLPTLPPPPPTPTSAQMHFQTCGTVNRVTILTDRGGNPKGYAYVEFLEVSGPGCAGVGALANAWQGWWLGGQGWLGARLAGSAMLGCPCLLTAATAAPAAPAASRCSVQVDAVTSACLLDSTELRGRQIKVSPKRTNVPGMRQARGRGRGRGGRGGGFYGYMPMPMPPPFMMGYGYGYAPRGRGRGRGGGYFPY